MFTSMYIYIAAVTPRGWQPIMICSMGWDDVHGSPGFLVTSEPPLP